MADKAQRVRGTQDIFGEEAARFESVVAAFDRVRRLYGFRTVHVPMFEFTEIFARSIGETTDVVSKEMYTFEDRGGESITLRPEFTAGISRAYLSNGWQQHAPLKLAAWGAAFRYERPQKGRYRQFHQLDAEIVGAAEPASDVEIIAFAHQLLSELGLGDKVVLQLNTVGDAETRTAWREALITYFSKVKGDLSAESQERLEKNPLRILDSKDERDKAFVADAPKIDAYLTAEAGGFFDKVQAGLTASGVPFVRTETLVRGLDYYRHTAFEFVTTYLGAQGTVLGGGRYDGLIEALGGAPTPAVGWAAGIERLSMLIEAPAAETVNVAVIPMGEAAEAAAMNVLGQLRASGIAAEQAWRGNMKKRMAKADAAGARFAVILGDDELAAGEATVKDLKSGEQKRVALSDLTNALK
ncbi:histidine--tRNA ligase [Sphingoaurantiacus capsulatus]|uniref:Histidine--tRNA ligase n=1 Tax=Sphingoaurantiacus capsulatus TaxID=1771310 RepID=A0ABV7X6Z1_9SPHN